jgi:hypothetical protein
MECAAIFLWGLLGKCKLESKSQMCSCILRDLHGKHKLKNKKIKNVLQYLQDLHGKRKLET